MKTYWLSPSEGQPWLSPDEVVARLRPCFPRVLWDAGAAQERARRFIDRYRDLIASGLADENSTPIKVVEHRWSGALLVEVWADVGGVARFQTTVCNEYRLELEFGRGIPARSRRELANAAARVLGYRVESFEGD